MEFNRWWESASGEDYWLEITDRLDLGVDLNAPQLGANGREQWHYSLIREVRDGDVVFHYHRLEGEPAIAAWSVASGEPWESEVVWAPHAGDRHEPERQAGWRLALEGFHRIDPPVTITELRANEDIIRVLEAELEDRHRKPLYTPFETGRRAIRPKQAYLTKLPGELVGAFQQLRAAADEARAAISGAATVPVPTAASLGEDYRRPSEAILVSETDPFSRDPSLVERGLRSHAETQNLLADHVERLGAQPRSPKPSEPNFDLLWELSEVVYVAEVKSINERNEERQLRLALGQVLRYRHSLAVSTGREVRAVIAASQEPSDRSWMELLEAEGVVLVWPATVERLRGT